MNGLARTLAATLVMMGMAAGCTASKRPSQLAARPSPSSVESSETTRQTVIAAYEGMWNDYQKDLATANWQNPQSARHATGEALLALENALAVDEHHGWIGKGSVVLHPIVKALAGSGDMATAEVVDCADWTHAVLYVAATGALKDSTPGGWHLVDAKLVVKGGTWKVSTFATGAVGSC